MPPTDHPRPQKTLQEVVDDLGVYPVDAFRFVEEGLTFTVELTLAAAAGSKAAKMDAKVDDEPPMQHITGQQLCEGLRQFAQTQWGLLAQTVLTRWRVNSTLDFGKIVYALIDAGHMQKTEEDSIDDFRDVYDFKSAFHHDYRIEPRA